MSINCVTHSGKFHADDVLTWAMLQLFLKENLSLIRTRDAQIMEAADLVFDVGGHYDPESMRFDHHQREYTGSFSSAGMTLNWLVRSGKLPMPAAKMLQEKAIDYVDAVDNGRLVPLAGSSCIATLIDSFNAGCETKADFDSAFHNASDMAKGYLSRLMQQFERQQQDKQAVIDAMKEADEHETNLIIFNKRIDWKDAYFDNGGQEHRTEFVIYPNLEGAWQAIAIPPNRNSFAQKRSFPMEWAGLKDDELALAINEPDAVFCHKNRFIAVFKERASLINAMIRYGLTRHT